MTSFIAMILIWSCIIYAMTLIITESKLFENTRKLINLPKVWYYHPINYFNTIVNCFLCSAVWISCLMSYILFSPCVYVWPYLSNPDIIQLYFIKFDLSILKILFLDGMLGCSLAYFLKLIENKLL